jgi:pheromone shutdown protein TraB
LSLTMKSSMAVNGCKTVVGVVGAGHLEGVYACLNENHRQVSRTVCAFDRSA